MVQDSTSQQYIDFVMKPEPLDLDTPTSVFDEKIRKMKQSDIKDLEIADDMIKACGGAATCPKEVNALKDYLANQKNMPLKYL